MQAAMLLTNQGGGTLFGSKAASYATGMQTNDDKGNKTPLPVSFGGLLVKKGVDAMHPDAPAAPVARPDATNPDNSAAQTAAARKRAREGAGQGSAADILTGGAGLSSGSQSTSSNVLLGS